MEPGYFTPSQPEKVFPFVDSEIYTRIYYATVPIHMYMYAFPSAAHYLNIYSIAAINSMVVLRTPKKRESFFFYVRFCDQIL